MKLGEESAFPALEPNTRGHGNTVVIEPGHVNYIPFTNGMSKRYFTACMLLQAKVVRSDFNTITNKDVTTAYELADELLKQETK